MEPGNSGGGGSNGSSDFVRKLYRMLEDPAHNDIVRWSATGDSFIVVDTNLFTTKILPQHFKHSNFASFVRQLNKYDFHKIKNTEEGATHQNGEFKHPEFTKDSKDNLDSIRRKAPQPRKNQQQIDEAGAQQLDTLQREFLNLRESSEDTVIRLQKTIEQCNVNCGDINHMQMILGAHSNYVRQHEDVIRKILAVLSAVSTEVQELRRQQDLQRGHNQEGLSPADTTGMGSTTSTSPETIPHNGSLSPLQTVKQLAHSYENIPKPNLQPEGINYDQVDPFGGYNGGASQNGNGNGMGGMNGLQQSQSNFPPNMGMMYNNNDSFAMNQQQQGNGGSSGMGTPSRQLPGRKRSTPNTPHWISSPSVLLVEDDPTCRRIGAKFLQNAHCTVDLADDGLIAVNKMRKKRYDLVLMDIMMPNLDGCSAAHLIRQFEPRTPIIAMTSNIRRVDIDAYFSNGMTDVLPKPFTKDGLLQLLERMLGHLKETGSINNRHDHSHIPPPIDVSHAHLPDHPIPEAPKTASSMKFSASPVPAKSPGAAVIYGHGASPSGMAGEQSLPQVHTPVTMEDGYMGIMGGYMEGNTPQPGVYGSPSSANKRRREDIIGPSVPPDEMYHSVDMKKQRY